MVLTVNLTAFSVVPVAADAPHFAAVEGSVQVRRDFGHACPPVETADVPAGVVVEFAPGPPGPRGAVAVEVVAPVRGGARSAEAGVGSTHIKWFVTVSPLMSCVCMCEGVREGVRKCERERVNERAGERERE